MDVFSKAWAYASQPRVIADLQTFFKQHLILVGVALAIGIIICVPLGIFTSRSRLLSAVALNLINGLRVIPSLAILFVFIALPQFGIGVRSALVALTVLALPPILINTDAGFRAIEPAIREAAFGMGMTAAQVLWRVEFPLALPVIVAGIRIALVEVIASATLAAYVGGGGLGRFITLGFSQNNTAILLVGAIPVALLAIAAELGMTALQRAVQPGHR